MNPSITYVFGIVVSLLALLASVTAGLVTLALRHSKTAPGRVPEAGGSPGVQQVGMELQKLKIAIHHVSDAVAVTDPFGCIQSVNPAFEQFTGYRRDAVIGRYYPEFVSEHHGETTGTASSAHPFQMRSWQGELKQTTKHGHEVEGRVIIAPVRTGEGAIAHYVVVKKDLTQQKKLETIAEAANLMNNSGYIFSSLRHEIANPLNSLKMVLSVLEKNSRDYSRDKIAEFVRRGMAELVRVEYLFDMFKHHNRYEKPIGIPARVDLFLGRFIALVTDDFAAKGIEIRKRIPVGEHWARIDVRALHQVMLNLFTNASDAVAGTGCPHICVALRPRPACMDISIEDNGCGMTEEEQKMLFRPFCTSKAKGTGIGLTIVKKTLSALNCGISIQSEKGRGTTVTIHLPLGASSADGATTTKENIPIL